MNFSKTFIRWYIYGKLDILPNTYLGSTDANQTLPELGSLNITDMALNIFYTYLNFISLRIEKKEQIVWRW